MKAFSTKTYIKYTLKVIRFQENCLKVSYKQNYSTKYKLGSSKNSYKFTKLFWMTFKWWELQISINKCCKNSNILTKVHGCASKYK